MTAYQKNYKLYNPGSDSFIVSPFEKEMFLEGTCFLQDGNDIPNNMILKGIDEDGGNMMGLRWTGWLSPIYMDMDPFP